MPTPSPGLKRVPRWRTMISPPVTRSPANTLTPRRLAFESRPFREDPRPFLCAILALRGLGGGRLLGLGGGRLLGLGGGRLLGLGGRGLGLRGGRGLGRRGGRFGCYGRRDLGRHLILL